MNALALPVAVPQSALPRQAESDDHLIDLWLKLKRSAATRKAYRADIDRFLAYTHAKPLAHITLSELVAFQEQLAGEGLAVTSIGRTLAAVKSLLSFGADLRYLPFNVGRALKPEHSPNDLAERILTEEQALAMITLTTKPRDRMLVRLAYVTGARVSEIVALRWRNVQSSPVGGQVALYGKGGKTRVVSIKAETFDQLTVLRGEAGPEDPVFVSQKGGPLDVSQAWRIIRAAGKRAGVPSVSPHWLRHSHASHALWRGASTATVRDTLGHSSLAVTSKYLHAKPGESSAHYLPA